MNLLLLHPRDIVQSGSTAPAPQAGRAEVRDERLHHLRRVLGVQAGDQIRVGVLDGSVGTATVESIDRERAVLDFCCSEPPPQGLDVDLLLALPRPKFLGRILQNAASMGVRSIQLFHSARVEKSYWSSRLFDPGAMERHLLLGLEQGRDTRLPELGTLRRFEDLEAWIAKWLAQRTSEERMCHVWLADGDGAQPFPRSPNGDAALVIGPEGGLLGEEVGRLEAVGARRVSLGPRPLRVETAVSVGLGRLLPDPT